MAAAAASSSGVPRESGPAPLPAPFSQDRKQQRQFAGLFEFVRQRKEAFDLMIYLPFTTPGQAADARMAPSKLIPGTLGLFPTRTSMKPRAKVASYPGVLMYLELHEKFNKEWHVPTALRVGVLDYPVDAKMAAKMELDPSARQPDGQWLVRMVLVGDPRAAGPIINSPFNVRGAVANCTLATCTAKELPLYLRKRTEAQGRKEVNGDFAGARRLSGKIADIDTELLLSYDKNENAAGSSRNLGDEGFWSWMRSDAESNLHCDQCFGKVHSANNPLFLCSHKKRSGAECSVGRHARCFNTNGFLFRHVDWYCSDHDVGQLRLLDTSALLRARSPPREPRRDVGSAAPVAPAHSQPTRPGAPRLSSAAAAAGFPRLPSMTSAMLRARSPPSRPLPGQSRTSTPSRPPLGQSGPRAVAVSVACPAPIIPPRSALKGFRINNAWDSDDDDEINDSGFSFGELSGEDNSDASDSDGSASDGSDSDGVVHHERPRLGHRVNSIAPLRIAKLPRSTTVLSEAGKIEVRQVWRLFESDLKKSRQTRWCPEPNTPVEAKKMQRLCDELQQLQKCCASMSKLLERGQGEQPAFTSHASMLRSRLQHHRDHNFDSKSMYASIRQTRAARTGFFWDGYPLCDTCYVAVVGLSRDTMYRNTGSSMALKDARRNKLFTKVDEVAKSLTDMAISDGQFLPTGEGAQGSNHFVLPFLTADACRLQLQQQVQAQQGTKCVISPTTFRRAIFLMRARQNISINIRKQKKLARCATCEQYSNAITLARLKKNATEQQLAQRLFDEHTEEWREQRHFFEERKQAALRCPWDLNVLTLDGMDTQKTSLPHYHRLTKGEGVENTLPVRVTGGFYIGGAVPCIGITSFDDVPAKGGAAAVTAIQTMINVNYECQDTDTIADIPSAEDGPTAADPLPMDAEPVAAEPVAAAIVEPVEAAAASEPMDESEDAPPSPPPKPKVPFMWPEGLHVTFDNTGSDCKNGHVFRFLGMLVALGVFCYITVSTLLVGHTHDIVDQMFSVWSRQLNVENAPTLEALHALFRKKYATQIYELKRMVDATKSERGVGAAGASVPPLVADRLVFLAKELGVQPMMILQSCVANTETWCYNNVPNISKPHVFYIVKEMVPANDAAPLGPKVEGVSMYNRFLARSYEDRSVNHKPEYSKVRFGPWTTRCTLLRMDEVPDVDPLRVPPMPVDTEFVELCLDQHGKEGNLSSDDRAQFNAQLDKFDAATAALKKSCAECARFVTQLDEIGPIHRPKNATAEQKKTANAQSKLKSELKNGLYRHMNAVRHESLVMHGWWTKWIDRVRTVIHPYYVARGLVAAPTPEQQRLSGRLQHPDDLVRDRWEPIIRRVRVDGQCETEFGLPNVGDFVLTRCNNPHQPFGLGVVVGHNGIRQEGEAEGAAHEIDSDAAAEGDAEADDARAEGEAAADIQSTAAAAAPAARRRASRSTAQQRSYAGCDDGMDDSDAEAEPRAEGAPPVARQAAKSTAGRAAGRKRATSSTKTRKSAAHSKVSRRSGGAAAASSAVAEAAAKPTEFLIQWWDFVEVAGDKQPNDPHHLKAAMEAAATDDAPLSAAGTIAAAASSMRDGQFARLPLAAIEHWRSVKYALANSDFKDSNVQRDELIWWGSRRTILTAANRLQSKVWNKIVIDLCEPNDVALGDHSQAT